MQLFFHHQSDSLMLLVLDVEYMGYHLYLFDLDGLNMLYLMLLLTYYFYST